MGKRKTLEVNGEIYDVLLNDIEVAAKVVEIKNRYMEISKNGEVQDDAEIVIDFISNLILCVDEILGEGALKKITQGQTPSFAESIELFRLITEAIIRIYEKDIKTKYA